MLKCISLLNKFKTSFKKQNRRFCRKFKEKILNLANHKMVEIYEIRNIVQPKCQKVS